MRCKRCGETMRAETVIKLRRSFGLVRATVSAGGYCMDCKIGTTLDEPATDSWARVRQDHGYRQRAAPICTPA